MVTIKQIAELAGVSRGTVDRVLNKRGKVHPETEKKINSIIKALNYTPNIAGKTLAVKKKQLKFGYVNFSSTSSNPFFEDVVLGMKNKIDELQSFGVTVEIRYATIDNPQLQVKLIDELIDLGIDGLAITPINHPIVKMRLKELSAKGFPIVTVNSDIPDCGRMAYVGSDYYKSGETAAGLMNMLTCGKAKVGIIVGSSLVLCHSERVLAFTRHLSQNYPDINIVAQAINNDDDFESFEVTKKMLQEHPEIDALFLAAAGIKGACHALETLGLTKKIKTIGYDATSTIQTLLRDGIVSATIAQQPFTQGRKPLELLFDYVGMGINPTQELYYTKIEIIIKENL